ncbi:MAG: PEP-CTERM sorting domain-containing protein [Tepidisphaeraceae bacterium]|jgi:PEP-CTERM motif-containing protein/dockerin type I repeat protein
MRRRAWRKLSTHRWRTGAFIAVGAITAAARAQVLNQIGVTALQSLNPSLTGSGVTVGQAEADAGAANAFEVSPASVAQPQSLFTYYNDNGTMTSTYNSAEGSGHANAVAANFYGVGTGVAPGVQHVDNYSAGYFTGSIISNGTAISDAIVNQCFIFQESGGTPLTVADQQDADLTYDDYVATYQTIFVSAVGNGGQVNAPATAYNSIGVGDYGGGSSTGPTVDNGRSKPDIVAPGSATSWTTPLVSGSAALLLQAGATMSAGATDPRTIKALLLNGAVKPSGWTHTHTAPLDVNYGAGILNVYNSYVQLEAGEQSPSVTSYEALGGNHSALSGGYANALAGWNFTTFSSSSTQDVYSHYLVPTSSHASSYTLTATLVWERPYETDITSNPINNLDLFLYDATRNTTTPLDYSNSTVDNVQELYDVGLTPGDTYDLEVFKAGGAIGSQGDITNSETYALAYDFAAVPAPGNLTWNNTGGIIPNDGKTWDTTNNNWNNGTAATGYADGSNVTFNDANNGHYAVTLTSTVSPGSVTVNNSLGNYTITGAGKIADFGSFVKTGSGTLTVGAALSVGSMSISAGTLKLATGVSGVSGPAVTSPIDLTALSITGNGVLDVNNDHLIITYGSSDPISTIANYIKSGYNGGGWNGPGIISTAALTKTNGLLYGVGYADGKDGVVAGLSSGQIEVAYTLLGDANLDGVVNSSDFAIMAANFNQSVTGWDQGDFTYTGVVNAADFMVVAVNFNQGVSGAASAGDVAALDAFAAANGISLGSVPEPASLGLFTFGSVGILARRRRRE